MIQQDTALALGQPGGQQQSTVLLSLSLSSVPLVPASLSNRPSVGLERTANEPGVIRHCSTQCPCSRRILIIFHILSLLILSRKRCQNVALSPSGLRTRRNSVEFMKCLSLEFKRHPKLLHQLRYDCSLHGGWSATVSTKTAE